MPDSTPAHAGHFQDLATQQHASELGMWVFLGSETLLFGGLFAAYTALRLRHGASFLHGAAHNDLGLGTVMTLVLIVSSFCVAWAIHALRRSRRRQSLAALSGAVALGVAFLAMKFHEYAQHMGDHILPGAAYAFEGLPGDGARMFFTMYYALTGLHALHVVGGLVALGWAASRIARGKLHAGHTHPLTLVGLYWHLVDVVWIFLWPMLYQQT